MIKGNWQIAKELTRGHLPRDILYRMMVVQAKHADVKLDAGLPYAVRGYAYWMGEYDVGRGALKAALKHLRDANLIQTKVKRAYGQTYLHVRLGRDTLRALEGHPTTFQSVAQKPSRKVAQRPTHSMKGCYMTYSKEVSFANLTPPLVSSDKPKEVEAGDVLLNANPSFASLQKVWPTYWKKHQAGPVDGLATSGKYRGMWKGFVGKCMTHEVNALHLVAHAIANWPDFRSRIKTDTGKGSGNFPEMGVVVANFPTLYKMIEGGKQEVASNFGSENSANSVLEKAMGNSK